MNPPEEKGTPMAVSLVDRPADTSAMIYRVIPAIMAEIGAITKNRKNVSQGYSFRGIDDVYNAVHDLLIKYKVFTVPEILEAKDDTVTTTKGSTLFYTRLLMQYTFFAEDGSSFKVVVRGEGMDSGDKASNKAMAVAHKYAFIQVFAIPTENGDDPENESHEITGARKLTPEHPEDVSPPAQSDMENWTWVQVVDGDGNPCKAPQGYWAKKGNREAQQLALVERFGPAEAYKVEKSVHGGVEGWYVFRKLGVSPAPGQKDLKDWTPEDETPA